MCEPKAKVSAQRIRKRAYKVWPQLRDARKTLEEWQEDYNWRRPHSALANMTPMDFLPRKTMEKLAA